MKKDLKPSTAIIPCPAVLLSVGEGSDANIITLSWVANVNSIPPSIAAGVRPERHSYHLLKGTEDFVINIPTTDQLQATIICGTKSGRNINKFKTCNFTQMSSTKIQSPMIAECPINIECKTKQVVELGSHHLFIGEVLAVHIDEEIVDEKGQLDVAAAKLFTFNPVAGGEYWALGKKLDTKDFRN
ncbi:MAG: flavin reductase family protein [Candidatus Hodarchaeales archaeon]|jgi:flavin reductase (DIM6/NTAB) family NADH-FMN oxidoreductase RutF